jgi:PleD family two-component response regulator
MNRPCKILIVDDESANLTLLRHILAEEPDYAIFAATSGEEALKLVANNPPDLILLDIILPGISGFEVLRALKDDPATKEIPVIIITGIDDAVSEEEGLLLGAVDYVTKPFRSTLVKARVKTQIKIIRHITGLSDALTQLMR